MLHCIRFDFRNNGKVNLGLWNYIHSQYRSMSGTRDTCCITLESMVTIIFFVICILTAQAHAATYYLSPTGANSNSGISTTSPWKTFSFAIPKLRPGDALVLRNGVYDNTNSGYPSINCGNNAINGTSENPITIRAENERQAYIDNDGGTVDAFIIRNCSYWVIDGLRMSRADNAADPNSDFMSVLYSDHITVKNSLFHNANRYNNESPILIYYTSFSLFEGNEFYYFHRHAMVTKAGTDNTFRRNYCNSRDYADISGTYHPTINKSRGDACLSIYPGSNIIVENDISEGNDRGVDIEALGASAQNNQFYGNISVKDTYGFLSNWRDSGAHNTVLQNVVTINPVAYGFFFRSMENTQCTNCTAIGTGDGMDGFRVDVENVAGAGTKSFFCTNCLAIDFDTYGIRVQEQDSWNIDYSNANNNGSANYSPKDGNVANSTQVDVQLGTCYAWIPDSSPMKGAGKNGTDIGANILYRYEGGKLTDIPLWDPVTGKFPCGSIVAGVNDIAGSSCFDVHKRLNVNANGCSFPSGYGKSSIFVLHPPGNLQILGN